MSEAGPATAGTKAAAVAGAVLAASPGGTQRPLAVPESSGERSRCKRSLPILNGSSQIGKRELAGLPSLFGT